MEQFLGSSFLSGYSFNSIKSSYGLEQAQLVILTFCKFLKLFNFSQKLLSQIGD